MTNPFLLVYNLLDYIIPPRKTDMRVRAMTLESLHSLQTEDGLPYHNDDVAALVWEIKYYANPHALALAGALLADEVVMLASEEVGVPLLIPVPMHKKRLKERGHNQTELICEAIGRALRKNVIKNSLARENPAKTGLRYGRPEDFFDDIFSYAPKVLVRTTATAQQQGLPKHKRLKNVHGSMEVVDKDRVKGRVCIVVDDVSTTGATLGEATRALQAAGARKVLTVALAHS